MAITTSNSINVNPSRGWKGMRVLIGSLVCGVLTGDFV